MIFKYKLTADVDSFEASTWVSVDGPGVARPLKIIVKPNSMPLSQQANPKSNQVPQKNQEEGYGEKVTRCQESVLSAHIRPRESC